MTPDELDIIKARWKEESRYRIIAMQPFKIFEVATEDIEYLLNRLEAAERAAKDFARIAESLKKNRTRNCGHPKHFTSQQVEKLPCPQCEDDSMIPKAEGK